MLLQAEKRILEEISKNSRAAQMEIHALLGKVYSDELALDLNRQSAKYARLQEKAEGTLKKEGEKPKPQGLLERSRCWAAIQTDTVWNISTEHVAEILLRDGSGTGAEKAGPGNRGDCRRIYGFSGRKHPDSAHVSVRVRLY